MPGTLYSTGSQNTGLPSFFLRGQPCKCPARTFADRNIVFQNSGFVVVSIQMLHIVFEQCYKPPLELCSGSYFKVKQVGQCYIKDEQ